MLAFWQDRWPAIGDVLTTQPTTALLARYPLVLAVLLAGIGYFFLRRATP